MSKNQKKRIDVMRIENAPNKQRCGLLLLLLFGKANFKSKRHAANA